jgi:hypothetical protein
MNRNVIEKDITPDSIQVNAVDIVPGKVIYSKVNTHYHMVRAFISLAVKATVNIQSETGVAANGDGSGASHRLKVDNVQKDIAVATDGFNDWNGTVQTTMVFEAGKTYDILAQAEFHDADPINTNLIIKVLNL